MEFDRQVINPARQVSVIMTGLILSPVLNFIYRSMTEGAKIELIVGKTTSFFSKDDIITAKEMLHISSGLRVGSLEM